MDIIPDIHWREDEQVQTQSSGDTEILEEQLHTKEDIQSQQQKDKEDTVTQEPVSLGMMDVVVEGRCCYTRTNILGGCSKDS